MKKKIVSVLLVAAMTATMFAGCGNSEGSEPNTSAGAESDDEEEMAEITVSWMTTVPTDASQTDDVEKAINEITEKEINTHVDIQWFDPPTYATQVPMMIQGNEKLDLMMYTPIPGAGYESFKSQKQLMNITEYLDEYGSGVKEALGDLLAGTSDETGVYGAASNRVLATDCYIVMRKDVLDDLGLTEKAQNMKTWTEYEDILKEVVAKTDLAGVGNADAEGSTLSVAPFAFGSENFAENYAYDNLGDTYQMITVSQDDPTVECVYFTEDYKKAVERADKFYKEGLIYKDAATATDYCDALIKNEVCFSVICGSEMGVEKTKVSSTGHELVCVKLAPACIGTSNTYKFGFAVPVCATEPEAAVKFLNLLYTNTDVEDILAWGVEGRDWVKEDGVAKFPEGVTAETVTYHMSDFLNGNQFITTPWVDNGADFRKEQKAAENEATVSKYMGFSFNAEGVENELTACYNVEEQYKKNLASGSTTDVTATLKELQDKMKAAGIDKVVEAYQTQLDAWLAAQK